MKQLFLTLCITAGLLLMSVRWETPPDLTGIPWSLSTLMGKKPVPGSGITAEFTSERKLSGFSGCNSYAGLYKVDGHRVRISPRLASSTMSCSQRVMDQETAYLEALAKVRMFSASRDQLTLKDIFGKDLMVFNAQPQDLATTSWEATAYNNGQQAVTSVLAGTTISAEFGQDGTLFGNSSCNSYSGPYKVTGNQITIGPLVSTKKACADPAGVMKQEAQYLAALETAATFKSEGKALELRTADGALAVDYTKQ